MTQQGSKDQVEIKPQPKPKTEPKTAQDFARIYRKLCEEYGFRVNVNPVFLARDDGTWSIVLQTSIGPLPKS